MEMESQSDDEVVDEVDDVITDEAAEIVDEAVIDEAAAVGDSGSDDKILEILEESADPEYDLDSWVGKYEFGEFIDRGEDLSSMFMAYEMELYKENDRYYADVKADGHMTGINLRAKLYGNDEWVSLVIDEYYPEHKSGLENMENMVLLSLRRQGENLYTYWGTWDVTKTFPNGRNSYDRYYYRSHSFLKTIEE